MNKPRYENSIIIISIFLTLISIWILSHPYKGIVHDSKLYTLQAMSHIKPEIFKHDLFLRFDSQENYSVFSYPYAFIIRLTNPITANIILFILGHILWFVSAWLLAGIFNKGLLKFISFAFAIAMPSFYGAKHLLSFGEPFLTPRIFAEALVLFSICFGLKRRFALCAIMLVMSFLLHPIMACTGAIFFFVYFFFERRRPTLITGLILLVIVVIPALFNISPFVRIFQFMDPGWAGIIQKSPSLLFLSNWTLRDCLPTIASFLVVLLYGVINRGRRRVVAVSLMASTGISLLLSLSLGDFLKNVLALQVQIWRTCWLLLFFSYLALPSLYIKIRKYSNFTKSFVAAYCAAWLSLYTTVFSLHYIVLVIIEFFLVVTGYSKGKKYLSRWTVFKKNPFTEDFRIKLDTILVILSIGLLLTDSALFYFTISKMNNTLSLIRVVPDYNAIVAILLLILCGIPLLYFHLRKKDNRLIALSATLFLISLTLWDQRLECEKLFHKTIGVEQAFAAENIPIKSEILWLGHPELSWFLLNRINYVSRWQAPGIVFSREKALVIDKRMNNIGLLQSVENPIKFYEKNQSVSREAFFADEIKKCCENAQDLDFIIVPYELPEYHPKKILACKNIRVYNTIAIVEYKDFDWYLYSCKRIRSLESK